MDDVSLDNLSFSPIPKYRRRLPGHLVQELSSGCSKVIWVKQVEAYNRVVHDIYRRLVNFGLAFEVKKARRLH